MRKPLALAVIAALIVSVITGAVAAPKAKAPANPDAMFVKKAAMGGTAEVQFGRLAAGKAESAEVKRFARQMVTDHKKANGELAALASKKGYKAPQKLDPAHKAGMAKLKKVSGDAFDKAYVKGQVKDHVATVALFENQAKNGKDADLKAWAAKTLPTLRHHLEMAKALDSGKKPAGSMAH